MRLALDIRRQYNLNSVFRDELIKNEANGLIRVNARASLKINVYKIRVTLG